MKVSFADISFDSEGRSVTRGGTALHLSPKAFDLLELLLGARPRAVRKEAIVDALWPDVIVEEANVRNLVAEIRGAIGEAAARTIVTLPRVGYAFRADAGVATAESRFALTIGEKDFALPDGVTLVGRGDDCGVIVRSSGVSRHHLRLSINDREAIVEDLGSKNGTWVNGKRLVAAVALRDGDEICAGTAVMRFRLLAAAHPTTTLNLSAPPIPHDAEAKG